MIFSSENLNVALLAFIPGLINLGIFIYSYYFFPKSKLSVTFSFIVLSAFLWQISEGFLRLTTDIEVAKRIFLILDSSSLLLVSSCLYFSLLFTKTLKNNITPITVTVIYLPSIFFIFAQILNWIPCELEYTSFLGYIKVTKHPLFSTESFYISFTGIICAFLLIKHWIKTSGKNEKTKAGLIAIGYSIPFFQGVITEIVFPEILNIDPIPLTTTSITFFSIASIIALRKYNLLSYSPYNVSEDIINLIADAILISDNDGVIKFVNPSFLKMMNYKEEELIGEIGYFLLADDESIETVKNMVALRNEGLSNSYEINMYTKDQIILNVLISASPYYNNNHVIGALSIIHDLTPEKKKTKELTDAMIIGEENERNRLAQDLHDGVNQSIVAIKMRLHALQKTIILDKNNKIIEDIIKITQDSIDEIRKISHNLYPLKKDEKLSSAIQKLILRFQKSGINFEFNLLGDEPNSLNPSIITNLYRVIQEFVNNTIKHANADLITINLNYTVNKIELEVKDNGCGFNYESIKKTHNGIGLKNMEKRIKIIEGTFDLHSKIKVGTFIFITFPF